MDHLLASLVAQFETCRADGVEFDVPLTIFAGGLRFDGDLLTFEEFERSSGEALRAIWQGVETATFEVSESTGLPIDEIRKRAAAVDPLAGSFHLAVSRVFAGQMEHRYSPPHPMRLSLDAVAGWTTGRAALP